jgi:hypothetical protein
VTDGRCASIPQIPQAGCAEAIDLSSIARQLNKRSTYRSAPLPKQRRSADHHFLQADSLATKRWISSIPIAL